MVEFRDVVKKYASDGEALGVKDSTVDGIPLGAAASMSPVEVVTDPTAQAALSGAFAQGVQVFPQTIPIFAGDASTLATSLTGIAAAYAVLDPDDYSIPAGFELQLRLVGQFVATTESDVVGVALWDFVNSVYLIAETTAVSPASPNNLYQVKSDWQTYPTAIKRTQVRARNQTAARGNIMAAWLELQVVAV